MIRTEMLLEAKGRPLGDLEAGSGASHRRVRPFSVESGPLNLRTEFLSVEIFALA
jgi:hypothetical protein